MTRAAVSKIMGDENMTPEQRTEAVMSLYGRALDDGYVSKTAAQTAQETAISNAKAEWEKSIQKPDIKASDEYKALESEFAGYKAMQTARTSDEYKGVKGKFFETVYGMVDKAEGAKPVAEQIADIRKNTEPKNTPQFSKQPGHTGTNPTSEEDKLYDQLSKNW